MRAQLLLIIAALLSAQTAAPTRPMPSDAATAESVAVQFARANLQLTEANLARVQQMNRKLKRTVPESIVSQYQQDVAIAKVALERALAGDSAEDEFKIWLRRADAAWKDAETNWQKAVAANSKSRGAVEANDVERYRLRAEVTRLQLARGQALASAPREAQLQWEVNLLNYELERLREETIRQPPTSRVYYPWWY